MTKSPIDQLLKPVSRFIHQEYTGGIILFCSVLTAIVWANSPWSYAYHDFWEMHYAVKFAGRGIDQPLHVWINDGLMALFFFVIGLELKREFMAGDLSTAKKASLPMMAALGGMLVPALIYMAFNNNLPTEKGWGIPMATDIAFALALLSLAGKHIPGSVKVFLSALAVADDLGAVLVIAFFYTTHIALAPLIIAAGLLLFLAIGNLLGVRSTLFYLVVGIGVWLCFLLSGVHATIAGVLVAFMIPARTKIDEKEYVHKIRTHADDFEKAIPQKGDLTTPEQHFTIEEIKQLCLDAETPLQKIEYGLHPWVAFVIMPLFALANAGMHLGDDFISALLNPLSLGIAAGLLVGKFAGITLFTWLMVQTKLSVLPEHARWRHIIGVAILGGVGFTMSLFITALAFKDEAYINQAKYGILTASFIAGVAGLIVLRTARKKEAPNRLDH